MRYNSAGGYSVLTPEGWSRSGGGSSASFIWNFDGERTVEPGTIAGIRTSFSAVKGLKTKSVSLPGGKALLATFNSLSAPDSVTGKQIRLENASYLFSRNGKSARLDLWAPQGSDNVDQWNKISRSFTWR